MSIRIVFSIFCIHHIKNKYKLKKSTHAQDIQSLNHSFTYTHRELQIKKSLILYYIYPKWANNNKCFHIIIVCICINLKLTNLFNFSAVVFQIANRSMFCKHSILSSFNHSIRWIPELKWFLEFPSTHFHCKYTRFRWQTHHTPIRQV